jgi:hypothetical protein
MQLLTEFPPSIKKGHSKVVSLEELAPNGMAQSSL